MEPNPQTMDPKRQRRMEHRNCGPDLKNRSVQWSLFRLYVSFPAAMSLEILPTLSPKVHKWYLSQRVHVPNNWVLGFWVIVIVVQVLGKYMIIRYLDP